MNHLSRFREIIWPLLDPPKKPEKEFIKLRNEDLTLPNCDLDKGFELALKYYESEEQRRNAVESKSTIFIGAIGFVIAILLDMTSGVLLNNTLESNYLTFFSILMWIIIVVYFSRTGWFALKALERKAFFSIGYNDFIKGKDDFNKTIIIDIINKTRLNSKTINEKVNNMVMAQEYFKRAIIAAVIYSITASVIALIFRGTFDFNTLFNFLDNNSKGFLYLNIFLLTLNVFVALYLRKKFKKLNRE